MNTRRLAIASLAAVALLAAGLARADEGKKPEFLEKAVPQFLSYGASAGAPFVQPAGIFYDREYRQVLVTDAGAGTVEVFDESGRPVATFRHWVTRNGERMPGEPRNVAVNKEGDIFLTDALSPWLDVMDFRGDVVESIDLSRYAGEEVTPTFMDIDDDDNLYVANAAGPNVLVFDPKFNLISKIGKGGDGKGGFKKITGVSVDRSRRVYVTDAQAFYCVQVFDWSGKLVTGFGKHQKAMGGFSFPSGAVATSDGTIWAADAVRQIVMKFDREGKILGYFGGSGVRPGDLAFPVAIAGDGRGRLYIAEKQGRRYQVFDVFNELNPDLALADFE